MVNGGRPTDRLQPSLTPRDYVEPSVYADELAHVLTGWLPVCRVDQLGDPGSHVAVTLAGRPVIAVMQQDRTVAVLANVCAHRGSRLVDDGAGNSTALVCPYHRWSYRLDGSLIGGPLTDGTDLDGACLPTVRHIVWEGFVLVDLTGSLPEPDLSGLSAAISPWRWSELVTVASTSFESDWNWKVMVENWIECYHHLGTHRDSVEPFQPARATQIIENDGAPWACMTVDSVDGVAGPPEDWMPGITPDMAHHLSVWGAFPLLLGGSVSRYAFWLHVVPIDVIRHEVTWYVLGHRDQLDRYSTERAAEILAQLSTVHTEDMVTCARVQAGLASGMLSRLRFTPLESPIADFQRWLSDRLHSGVASGTSSR